MNVKNANYSSVRIDLDGVTFPLRAGTPIGLSGRVENGALAVGLVPQTIAERPLSPTVRIVTGGDAVLSEIEEAFGSPLSEDAKAAMSGIRFFGEDGTPEPDWLRRDEQYVLPAATEETAGGVKRAETVALTDTGEEAAAAKCAAAINALICALLKAGSMSFGITGQPENGSGEVGDTVTFTVTAPGESLTYQWQRKGGGSTAWVDSTAEGNKTATLSVSLTSASQNGLMFRCKVTGYGQTVISGTATLTVQAES